MNGPTYKAEIFDRIVFSRWDNPPTKEDMTLLFAQVQEASARLNSKLIYIASVSAKSKVPDANDRAILNQFLLDGRRTWMEQAWLIYEGSDLQHNLQRVIISGVLILTRTFDNFLSVAKSGDSIIKDVSAVLKKDATPLFAMAKERGLLVS